MKEAFVLPAPREPPSGPRHRPAHTNINDNILRLFYQDGETPGGLAAEQLVK